LNLKNILCKNWRRSHPILMHKQIGSRESLGATLIFGNLLRTVTAIAVIAISVHSADARSRIRVQKAHVRFLAASTFVRGTWGYNQDIFLAELLSSRHGEPLLVRLIDEYPNTYPSLSADVLASQTGTALRVKRDSQCDSSYASMLLRTAPNDPRAILHERLGYTPQLAKTPEPDAILPCYRTVRY
jgi:hypothetical protein